MSLGYCLFCLASLLTTLNLYRPPTKNGTLGLLAFIIGVLVGELAPFVLLLQMAVVALCASEGLLQQPANLLFSLLLLPSWLGLITALHRANRSADGLRQQLDNFTLETETAPLDWRRIARPFSIRLSDVICEKDIPYREVDSQTLALDLYRPRYRERTAHRDKAPVLLYFHGGGLLEIGGSRRGQGLPLLNELASRGWCCVSIDYRLSPRNRWPAHLLDCKAALHWIKQQIAGYGGDADFVAVAGDSAGGQLAALMALTANCAALQTDSPTLDSRVQAAICHYGVMDFCNLYRSAHNDSGAALWARDVIQADIADSLHAAQFRSASPIACAEDIADRETIPDCLLIHGSHDSLVAAAESRLLAEKLRQVSPRKVLYAEITGAQHAFNVFRSLRSERVLSETVRFAEHCHQHWQQKNGKNTAAR